MVLSFFSVFIVVFSILLCGAAGYDAMPDKCDACQVTSTVLLKTLGRYRMNSEASLIEWIEGACPPLQHYHMHKEKKGSERFQPDESATMRTIQGLKDRGVQIDLGYPHEFLDEPEAEIVRLKILCEDLVSRREEELEEWFLSDRKEDLKDLLCNGECATWHMEF